ncbi:MULTISPECIES: protease pro-enzyme activation domain-containing protein [Streptacidiphilus]|uniref:Protease pro-enzyme activation domain-containing protein n=2 Tax=Streptacidiphilus TaxID=228398 RepID=A0ABV6UEY4_9ACTN|nr:S53 family peptidase [Streptacidiphilus jeojiense]
MSVAHDRVALIGSERKMSKGQSLIGSADSHEKLTVTVQVRRHPNAAAAPDLAELGRQRPSRRAPVDRKSVLAALGADPKDLDQVKQFAQQFKLKAEQADPAQRTIRLTGTVEQFNQAFGVQLKQYREGDRTFRSRQGSVHVPRHLQGVIERVSGLTNRPLAQPHHKLIPRSPSGVTAQQVAQLYDFPQGVDCSGQTIALIELGGGYSQQDLDTYFNNAGIPSPNVMSIGVDGASNSYGDPSGADGEVELDIEIAASIAQAATIAVYFAPNSEQGFIDAVLAAATSTQHPATCISISWGAPEDAGWTAAGRSGMDFACFVAAALGITVLAASGDNGSNDGVYDGMAHCDFPSSDPYVLACGGTSLQLDNKGMLRNEVVWNNGNGWATGGGISNEFLILPWQTADEVPLQVDTGQQGRGVPDVAGNADPMRSPYEVVVDGAWMSVGGTSAVAPLYAGLFAVIAASSGTMPGFIGPYLYQLASQPNLYFDVDSGSNAVQPAPGYSAGKGWDACSGIGRINGNLLLQQI